MNDLPAAELYVIGDCVFPTDDFKRAFQWNALKTRGLVVGFSRDKRLVRVRRQGQVSVSVYHPKFWRPARRKCPKHKAIDCYVCRLFSWQERYGA